MSFLRRRFNIECGVVPGSQENSRAGEVAGAQSARLAVDSVLAPWQLSLPTAVIFAYNPPTLPPPTVWTKTVMLPR